MRACRNPLPTPTCIASLNVLSKTLLLLCWMALCADTLANCLKNTQIQLLGNKHDHCQTLKILPIRLMESKTLFLSAAEQRDRSMGAVDKLLNNRWLMQSAENTFSGSEALRSALRMGLLNAWQSQRGEAEQVGGSNKGKVTLTQRERPLLFDLRNYDIHVSSDQMAIGFSYSF